MPIDMTAFQTIMNSPKEQARKPVDGVNADVDARATAIVTKVLDDAETGKVTQSISEPETAGYSYVPPELSSELVDPSIDLDESQVEAINALMNEQYGCLIGAAGSGKTTCLRFFLQKLIYEDESFNVRRLTGKQGINIALCSFTGMAVQVIKQNMPSWLHGACKTIHELLEFAPVKTETVDENGKVRDSMIFLPSRDRTNKLDHDVIVIDEASMVGIELWHQLLDACRPGTRIYLIGDLNQLKPVIGRSMFAHALSNWHVSELTHIHRQKEPAANRIVDAAHAVLSGDKIEFDDQRTNKNWRVIGFMLDDKPQKAGQQIVAIANQLRRYKVDESIDPDTPLIYDPYRDRIITAGNGLDETSTQASVQQSVINVALSRLIEPPSDEHPVYVIDAGRETKRFAVGHRVMATRNEPPGTVGRVTNGLVGRIVEIKPNDAWSGDRNLVGPESQVNAAHKRIMAEILNPEDGRASALAKLADMNFDEIESFETGGDQTVTREGGGPASHIVCVRFMNEEYREFKSKVEVESLMLAYASTCHKCQGSQFETAIIVVHHAVKGQLSREWLYTAITRAQKRVILLYTDYGVRAAIARQQIFGRNLKEKIERYVKDEELQFGSLLKAKIRIRLSVEE